MAGPLHHHGNTDKSKAGGWLVSAVQTLERDTSIALIMADWKRVLSDIPISNPTAYFVIIESLLQT